MQTFTRKYQPANCKEMVGQDSSLSKLRNFISNFKKQKNKAALIYGPSGVGKTCSVYAVANDLNYEVIEVNASDFRNKEQINSVIGNALKQQSLFAKSKVILVDEIDGLSGAKDRGGVQALTALISDSKFPVVMTSMNPYDLKLNSLRKKADLIEFQSLDNESIFKVLQKICDNEKIKYKKDVLKSMSRRAGGDLRGSINDLQSITIDGELTEASLEGISDRKKVEAIPNALVRIFKTTDVNVAKDAFEDVEEDLDALFLWIDENLPKEYSGKDLVRAYEKLSKADVFRGRIRRWQHWRFLVYVNSLMTAGVAAAKDEKNKKPVVYQPTGRLLKIWWANQKNMKKKAIAAKLAKKTHCSRKRALQDIPYIQNIFKNNKIMATAIAEELALDKEEVDWLKK